MAGKSNPNHKPAGSPEGGEFASGSSGSSSSSGSTGGQSHSAAADQKLRKLTKDDRRQLKAWAIRPDEFRGRDGFTALLDKLPTYVGTVYRGTDFVEKQMAALKVGATFNVKLNTSASKSSSVAKKFAENAFFRPVLLQFSQSTAADLAGLHLFPAGSDEQRVMDYEHEVVLKKGTNFKIDSFSTSGKIVIVSLSEKKKR